MDFPKKQAQRLMPLYLLEYSEKLFTNHPDPSAPWGGGSDYTAGQGITITNNEISVDTNVIATKSDIPTNYVTTDTEQTITGLKTIGETSGTISEVDFSGFTFKLSNKAINHPEADIKIRNASYDGYQYPTIYSTKGLYVNLAKIKLGDDGNNTYGITMPDSSTWESDRVLATTNDIPTVNNPTITFTQGGVAKGSITLNQSTDQTIEFDAGSSSVDWQDITNKPNLLPIMNATESFTFTETGSHMPPYKWGENMACTSTGVCYGSVEALPQIYLQHWFGVDECYAYPQYMWQDPDGYHAVYSTELVQDNTGASGGRIVLNAPQVGATWTSVSTYPTYSKIYTAGTGIDITNNTISIDNTVALKSEVPSTATSTSTSTVTPTTGTFVTGTSTSTTNVVNSVTYTPSAETLTFTYDDNTTASFTFLTSSTMVTSDTTSVVTSVTDSTSNAMTGATVSTSTSTTLS